MERGQILDFVTENINNVNFNENRFLYILSNYLESLEFLDVETFEKGLKDNVSIIKKATASLEEKFDKVFLLFSDEIDSKLFIERENYNLLCSLEYLVGKLGERDYIDEAEKLNHLKIKLSLGYERYFKFNDYDLTVEWFSSDDYNFQTYREFDLDSEFEVETILNYYYGFSEMEFVKNYEKKFFDFCKYLEGFPQKIYRGDNSHLIDIQKSIFFDNDFEIRDFGEKDVKTAQFNSINIATKLLQIYNKFDLK